ncbi:MAG: GCN5-related N-acetyltransferase [Gemmatimonadetes bacterium]|nr:GCN5-related N-acetyltransferase [Gemmatimonadota bacterium]
MSPVVEVVRTYLELRSPEQLRAARTTDPHVRFVRRESVGVEQYRRLYRAVGDQWHWHDRNAWPDERITSYFASPNVYLWECLVGNESAGYFELARSEDGSVEVVYFGLAAPFIGRGLGKAMLTRAAEEAWALGPSRVWLHTCTLDSPHALPNYRARGFEVVKQETYVMQLP